jgi:ATP-binding protein involved in chromosome partitioning
MLTKEQITDVLKTVKFPGYSRDIVSFGLVKNIALHEGEVVVSVQLTTANPEAAQQITLDAEAALSKLPGVRKAKVDVLASAAPQAPNAFASQQKVIGIKRIIAVASGKGGVGKSTVSVNLACALKHLGNKVGLLDCDIYGPSIPLMMGVTGKPNVSEHEMLVPHVQYGVKLMSMGFLVEGDQPIIWRGPMIVKTIQQFFFAVDWDELDYLLVDLPPGTGDAQITLCQTVPLDGGVIVTTPQEASLGVVRKGVAMFEKVNVPILGMVENMSYFTTPDGQRVEIFGHGGGRGEAARKGVPFLGEVPIFTAIREGGDRGLPVVVSDPNSPAAQAFIKVAEAVQGTLKK